MNKIFILDVYTPRYSFEIQDIDSFSEDDFNRLMKNNLLVITNQHRYHMHTFDIKALSYCEFLEIVKDCGAPEDV